MLSYLTKGYCEDENNKYDFAVENRDLSKFHDLFTVMTQAQNLGFQNYTVIFFCCVNKKHISKGQKVYMGEYGKKIPDYHCLSEGR